MIELFNLSIFIIFIFFLNFLPKKLFFLKEKNYTDHIQIYSNVLILFYLLICSFLGISIDIVSSILVIIFLINLYFIFKENFYLTLFSKNNWLVILFTTVFAINLANNMELGWDAQNYWIIKFLNFKEGMTFENLKFLPRPEYPHFGPYVWAVYSNIFTDNYEYFGRVYFIYFFCLSLKYLLDISNLKLEQNLIAFLALVLIIYNNSLFNGYQEVFVFSNLIILSIYIYFFFHQKFTYANYILIVVVSLFLFWIKNESSIFALILLTSLLLFKKEKKLIILSIVCLVLFKLMIFKIFDFYFVFQEGNYENFELSKISSYLTLERLLLVLKYLSYAHLKNPITFLIFISIYWLLLNKDFKSSNYAKYYFSVLTISYLFIISAYIFMNWHLEFGLKTSVYRLLFQSIGAHILIIVLLNSNKKKLN
jgi:hypothetical protein|tara:strand:- start:10852 stop:12120 length:1269 start_codon:yes stop_codon:yes gene_type:complete